MEHESDCDIYCNFRARYSHQRTCTVTAGHRNERISIDHRDYSTFKISQNTEKSPGDLKRLTVTKTPVRSHRVKLL